jgi:hypothetical protein
LDESTEDMYILLLIRLNKLGLVVPVPMLWHGFLFLVAAPAVDGVDGRRRARTSMTASQTARVPAASVKGTTLSDLECCQLWIEAGSSFVPPLSSLVLLSVRIAAPVKKVGGMSTNSLRNRVGLCLPPLLVVQLPFGVLRRLVCRDWRFLGRQIPHGLAMRWPAAIFYSRIVQCQQSMSFSMCCSRRHQKSSFHRRGGGRP